VSHLRDSASWIWPGGVCWHRSLSSLAVNASETQEGVPKASAQDAGIRSWRLCSFLAGFACQQTTRRQKWTKWR
jgi:hypothetical protein